jgi:hypothetical protein
LVSTYPQPRLSTEPLERMGYKASTLQSLVGDRIWRSQVRRELTINIADRIACSLGLHPALVWGDEWWEASRIEWERCARWPAQPLVDRGLTGKQVRTVIGRHVGDMTRNTLSTKQARQVCEHWQLDPVEVWGDEWIWGGP